MEFKIRTGTAEDLVALLQLWLNAEAEPTHTDDLVSLQELLAFDANALLVAQAGNDLAGSVIAGWDGWRGSIYRLAVAPEYRRQGVARKLVQAATARLEKAGAARLQAIVVENDVRAMGFWSNLGWERQVLRVRFVKG